MNGITDPNWPSGHPRQLPSSILPSGSGGELKNLELNRRSKEDKPECGQRNGQHHDVDHPRPKPSHASTLLFFIPFLDVRFGSLADICSAKGHVRFTPNSDRESGFPHKIMSALPPKADMCSALAYVCFGPIADIATYSITSSASNCIELGIARTAPPAVAVGR